VIDVHQTLARRAHHAPAQIAGSRVDPNGDHLETTVPLFSSFAK
jgi:hypothetical protein